MIDIDDIDPETYVQENRDRLVQIIRHSDDPFARACAWTMLDRYTPDQEIDELHDELDSVTNRRVDV